MITTIIFDWGNTVMKDFGSKGPMWPWEKVSWVDGAREAMHTLSKSFQWVIATNADLSGTEDMIKALKRVGASDSFSNFFSSKYLGSKKPQLQFFVSILNKLKCRADHCIMVGDSCKNDITVAKSMGMSIILLNNSSDFTNFPAADYIIANMSKLTTIMRNYVD